MASTRTEDIILSLSVNGKTDAIINGESEITITPDILVYGTLPDTGGVTGYTFGGWYFDEFCIDGPVTEETEITTTESHTLYAKWIASTYKITFDANGHGTPDLNTKNVDYDCIINTLASINADGYEFGGWYTDPDCTDGNEITETSVYRFTTDITVYAKWTPITIKLTFASNGVGDIVSESKDVTYDSVFGTLPSATSKGYTFGGWYTDPQCTDGNEITESSVVKLTSDTTLYAKWTANKIDVVFNTNAHGTEPDPITIEYGNSIDNLPVLTTNGYTFGGWYTDPDCTDGNEVTSETHIISDLDSIILYAKWTANTITVKFVTEHGETPEKTTVIYGNTIDNLPVLTVDGYTFGGWYRKQSYSDGTKVTSETVINMANSNLTLYAKWTQNTTTVIFDTNGIGIPPESTTIYYGETIEDLPIPTENGYTFGGWYTDPDCTDGNEVTSETVFKSSNAEPIILYAKWTAEKITITFNNNGIGLLESEFLTGAYGSTFEIPTPVADEYEFAGWYTDHNCTDGNELSSNIFTENLTLYAKWIVINDNIGTEKFRLKVVSDPSKIGFTSTPIVKVNKYGTYRLPTPIKAGYRLIGWDVVKGNSYITNNADVYTLHMVNQDTEVRAKWEAKLYNINLNVDGGEYNSSLELTEIRNKESVTLKDPIKTGYKFIGWSDGMDNTYTSPFNMPDEDLTLTAQFEPLVCTVYFSVAGIGTLPTSSIEVTYGSAYGTLPTPTAENHTFGGWYETPECDGDAITESSVLEEEVITKRLYAKWTLKSGASDSSLNTSLTMNYALFMLTKEEALDPSKTGWAYAYANSHRWVKLNALLKEQLVDPDWSRDTLAFVYAGTVYDVYKDYIDCDSGTRVFILKPSVRGSDCITF